MLLDQLILTNKLKRAIMANKERKWYIQIFIYPKKIEADCALSMGVVALFYNSFQAFQAFQA